MKTPDGKDVFIPNANIIKNPLINYTIDGFLRHEFTVNLPGHANYKEALKAITTSVNQVEGVLKTTRKSTAEIISVSAGKFEVRVSYWIDTFKEKQRAETIRTQVIHNVHQTLGA